MHLSESLLKAFKRLFALNLEKSPFLHD